MQSMSNLVGEEASTQTIRGITSYLHTLLYLCTHACNESGDSMGHSDVYDSSSRFNHSGSSTTALNKLKKSQKGSSASATSSTSLNSDTEQLERKALQGLGVSLSPPSLPPSLPPTVGTLARNALIEIIEECVRWMQKGVEIGRDKEGGKDWITCPLDRTDDDDLYGKKK